MKKPLSDSISLAEHPSDIVAHAAKMIASGKRFALITSVAIAGGAAREVGSLAVLDQDGEMTGYLSNGCIDKDIQLHAVEALRTGEKILIRYGDGSQFVDLKLPCGGSLSVLIDPAPDRAALSKLHENFRKRESGSLKFTLPDHDPELPIEFTYRPQYRLVIAGRGAIFRALAQVGRSVGFGIFCLSPDEDDLSAVGPICDVAPIHLVSSQQDVNLDIIDRHSAFLTLFHDHDWEPGLLHAALQTRAQFIGCLGSRRTHAMRIEHLKEMAVSQEQLARLKGPIGLVPSLRDAPLIATSTLAEIISGLKPSISMVSASVVEPKQ
jgi:xanthine dehydrogenase accessory factor